MNNEKKIKELEKEIIKLKSNEDEIKEKYKKIDIDISIHDGKEKIDINGEVIDIIVALLSIMHYELYNSIQDNEIELNDFMKIMYTIDKCNSSFIKDIIKEFSEAEEDDLLKNKLLKIIEDILK